MVGLAKQIERAAAQFRSRIAAVDGDRTLTFGALDDRSNRLANALVALSPEPAARVAIMLPNSLEFLETDFAAVKARKAKVPINLRLAEDEREWILQDSGASVLVTDEEGAQLIAAIRGRIPSLETIIVVGEPVAGLRRYEDMLSEGSPRLTGIEESPDAPNVILYTSGTSGRPKGAVSSARGRLLTTIAMLTEELDIVPGDGMIHAGSMAHGSGSKSLAFFFRGGRNIMMRRFDGACFFELLRREGATNSFLVPTMIQTLVKEMHEHPVALPTLKTITYGGSPISDSLLREALEAFGDVFVQVYGSCEAPHPVTVLKKHDHVALASGRASSIGREVMGVELRLADDDGQPAPEGIGELLVRGDSIMQGYWQQPDATADAFVDGFYRTGDVARRDDEGYYYLVDRKREMIISGGLNVYPAEVERVISQHEGVREVAVIGIPDPHWGEAVIAVVVPAAPGALTETEIAEYCAEHLAGYKKPRRVEFRDQLPKGSSGKILKREIRAPYWEGRERLVN